MIDLFVEGIDLLGGDRKVVRGRSFQSGSIIGTGSICWEGIDLSGVNPDCSVHPAALSTQLLCPSGCSAPRYCSVSLDCSVPPQLFYPIIDVSTDDTRHRFI